MVGGSSSGYEGLEPCPSSSPGASEDFEYSKMMPQNESQYSKMMEATRQRLQDNSPPLLGESQYSKMIEASRQRLQGNSPPLLGESQYSKMMEATRQRLQDNSPPILGDSPHGKSPLSVPWQLSSPVKNPIEEALRANAASSDLTMER